ncbi:MULTISPECIES: DEAD/DEAH box helicase [Clostridium]|uniref:ATP-dependent RNA helicase CshA n=1 Tax=Clostridium novyi (strain NT) TaxID=386415 RepID=A0PXJ2_CLONN|nr:MULTISPECIES: DEAD/DEAH box helicase [Clostridium]ABK62091.1 ATP-dependent RNA helicase [Clostridium novyi NT]KEH87171.1 RNA helicase [Clostridium novyi A str. NCTC 538]KEH89868.1 RNA helicase [Clostridium novyi A str. 4540]KEH90002.1 RNA helicase [Clostridium novyi A str. BKT29909]KEH94424.1 RNA helicase [Clostridium novyi A str. GD211209]
MEKIKFENLPISDEIKSAIADMGFEEPSPIQEKAIPFILSGKDIIGQAQTGTGKTAAFGIPALDTIDLNNRNLQIMVLCPTRELAIQATQEITKLGKYKKGLNVLAIYGGQPIDRQIKALKRGVQIVIGTPGRVIDHINRKTLKTDNIKMVVLDEADEMLDMGFRDDIETIIQSVPENRQTILFSATMPKAIVELSKKYQTKAEFIKVVHRQLTVPNIEQRYIEVKENFKIEVLSRLIDMRNPKLSVIFCNTKKRVDEVVSELQSRGYFAEGLHGDMKQPQRDRVMSKFRNGTIEILVATDVAARGIDVDDVEAVFNYDLPQDEEYYVHRIGRTGRAGRSGIAFTFVAGKAMRKLRDIERYTKTKIKRAEIPSANDVEEFKANTFLEKVKNTIEDGHLGKYIDYIENLLDEDFATIDIASALLKMALGEEKKEEVIEIQEEIGETGAEPGMVRLFINIGRNHKIQARDVIGAIAGETGIPGKVIGKIDIYEKFTFVEVPRENAREVLGIMKNNTIKGKKINIEPANAR